MNLARRADLDRGLWPEALVAGLASLSTAWPLTTLLIEQTWLPTAVVLVAAVALTGCVLRTLDLGPSWVSLGQLAVGAVGISWALLPDTLWRGLPTWDTAVEAAALLQEAGVVLRTYAAPAPTTDGVVFLVVAVLLLTAVAVDTLGVTGGAPAAAGIPLVAAFLVSVSNSGDPMAPVFFVTTAALWMVMMAQQGGRVVEAWPSRDRRELVGGDDVSLGRTGHRTVARLMGLAGLATALVVAGLVPHLPPTFLAEGLGRNAEGNDLTGGGGQVDFVDTMDPSADLNNQSLSPVFTYTTSAAVAEPLKVTATADYLDGEWQPPAERPQDEVLVTTTGLGVLPGLPGNVPNSAQTIQVRSFSLQPPYLASPAPLREVEVEGGSWVYDRRLGTARLAGDVPVEGYRAGYYTFAALDEMPDSVGSTPVQVVPGYGSEVLDVPPEMAGAVTTLAEEVVGDEDRPLEVAVLLQQHFRTGYTYDLELLPDRPDVPDEPISQFLANRQGYCLQFATAMTMMARSQGIPARMALGFIPGELDETGGSRTVRAADAHTWPELWLDGLGWTRFEPTPAARVPTVPRYTQPEGAVGDELTATQEPATPPDLAPDTETPQEESDLGDAVREVLQRLGWVLVGLLVLGALMMLVPLAGRWYRTRDLRLAETPQEEVEAQWLVLTRSLTDLGVPEPGPQSPRAMHRHYADHAALDRRADEALGRVATTLERVRYARPTEVTGDVERDVDTVVETVREAAPRGARLRAVLLPRTGLIGIRELLGGPQRVRRSRGARGATPR